MYYNTLKQFIIKWAVYYKIKCYYIMMSYYIMQLNKTPSASIEKTKHHEKQRSFLDLVCDVLFMLALHFHHRFNKKASNLPSLCVFSAHWQTVFMTCLRLTAGQPLTVTCIIWSLLNSVANCSINWVVKAALGGHMETLNWPTSWSSVWGHEDLLLDLRHQQVIKHAYLGRRNYLKRDLKYIFIKKVSMQALRTQKTGDPNIRKNIFTTESTWPQTE